MKFSMWIPSEYEWSEVADLAQLADAGDWDTVWFADHYMPNTGDLSIIDGDIYEAWSILPAIAAITSRVRIGPLVSPTSIHHPALLAKRAATIDRISNGRFVLGLGAGWQINEHNAYGFDLEAPGPRVSRFEEAIEIVRSLLDNERTTFDGAFYSFADAPAQPRPVQDQLPIVVGTASPRMLRATARFAQEWNTWGEPSLAAEKMQLFHRACDQVGTDPQSMRKSVQALVFMSENPETLAKYREIAEPGRAIVGTPAELVEQIGQYQADGFDEFILLGTTLGKHADGRHAQYEKFAAEVISQF